MALSTTLDDEQDLVRQAPTGAYAPWQPSDIQSLDSIANPPEPKLADFLPANYKAPDSPPPTPAPQTDDTGWGDLPKPAAALGSAPAPAAAPTDERAAHLAALNAILGDSGDEESAIRSASDRDRTRADQRQMSEFIAAAGRRQPAQYLPGGPSDMDTEKLIQQSRDKRQALLAKGLDDKKTGNEDPSLQLWRQAEAEAARARSARDAGELERQKAKDASDAADKAAKRDAGDKKLSAAEQAKADEEQSVQQSLADFAQTDLGKKFAVDPEKLKGIKTQKQFDSYVDSARKGLITPPRPGKGGGGPPLKPGEVPKDVGTYADGLYNGNIAPDELKGRLGSKLWPSIEAELKKRDPNFSTATLGRFHTALKELDDMKPGSTGDIIQSSKTAFEHVNQLEDAFKKMSNGGSRGLNDFRNMLAEKLGIGGTADNLAAFKAGANTAGEEFAKAYGANTEGGRHAYETIFNPASQPSQIAAAMAMIKEQLVTRLKERDSAIRRLAQSPGQIEKVDKLGIVPHLRGESAAPSAPAVAAPSAPKEGDERTTSTGKTWVFRNGEWAKK